MVSEIGVGKIIFKKSNGDDCHFATSGGYVEVADNHVILLAETIEAADEIDLERAESAFQRSNVEIDSPNSEEKRREIMQAIERAKNRIRIAKERK
jgi:F0F1-type ATP synthase, epsilon subunit (mitochondrial delta subunit)